MASVLASTPQELGEALRKLREARGITLETIAAKTKISPHTLHALEAGNFARLPPPVFTRMFLRQILPLLGEDATPWVATFNTLWKRWEDASHPHPVVSVEQAPPKPWGRWLLGILLPVLALAAVFWLQQRQQAQKAAGRPTPRALVGKLAPTPPPTPTPQVEATPAVPPPGVLVVESLGRECWVEWRVGEKTLVRRLLEAGGRLELSVGQARGELVLGDAGAVRVRFADTELAPAGRDGQVVRLAVPLSGQRVGP